MAKISVTLDDLIILRDKVLHVYTETWHRQYPTDFPKFETNTHKKNYIHLCNSFQTSLGTLLEESNPSYINVPGVSFWVKFFTANGEISCRKSSINACYFYVFGKSYDEYCLSLKDTEVMENKYHILPATFEDIRKIFTIASTVYQGLDVIPLETMLTWYGKNPLCFYVIKNMYDEVVGNIDILPLTENCVQRFINGEMIEREIQKNDIIGIENKKDIEFLYIESLVSLGGFVALSELLQNIPMLLMNFGFEIKNIKKIYCISASKRGQDLIEKLGFTKIKSAEERMDGHDLFAHDIKELILAIANLFKHKFDYTSILEKF